MTASDLSRLDPDMAAAEAKDAELAAADGPPTTSIVEDRARQQRLAPFWAEEAPSVEQVDRIEVPGAAGGLRAILYRPAGSAGKPLILFLHSGGWARGSVEASEYHCRALAAWSGLPLLATSYRLAPEHPYPAALDDVLSVWRWCERAGAGMGFDAARLLFCGASAGGNLALAAALRRRDEEGRLPAGFAFYFGVFGSDLATPSYLEFGDGRFGLSQERMAYYFGLYAPPGTDRNHPYFAPLNGELHGLPPCWLGVAELDVLRDDSLFLEGRLRAAGVTVESVIHAGLPHAFTARARLVPKARAAIADGARWLKARAG